LPWVLFEKLGLIGQRSIYFMHDKGVERYSLASIKHVRKKLFTACLFIDLYVQKIVSLQWTSTSLKYFQTPPFDEVRHQLFWPFCEEHHLVLKFCRFWLVIQYVWKCLFPSLFIAGASTASNFTLSTTSSLSAPSITSTSSAQGLVMSTDIIATMFWSLPYNPYTGEHTLTVAW